MGPSSQTCLLFRALVSCYLGLAARGDVGEKATSITAKNSLGWKSAPWSLTGLHVLRNKWQQQFGLLTRIGSWYKNHLQNSLSRDIDISVLYELARDAKCISSKVTNPIPLMCKLFANVSANRSLDTPLTPTLLNPVQKTAHYRSFLRYCISPDKVTLKYRLFCSCDWNCYYYPVASDFLFQ